MFIKFLYSAIFLIFPLTMQAMEVEPADVKPWGEGSVIDADDDLAVLSNTSFYPLQKKGEKFLLYVNGFLPREVFQALVKSEIGEEKELTEKGSEIIHEWTNYDQDLQMQFYTKINLLLATDNIDRDSAMYPKKLKSLIGWQTPKYQGKTFRGALHSPLEIFLMMHQDKFFLPTFVASSMSWNKKIYRPHPDSAKVNEKIKSSFQNIVFEIDNSEFPNFSTCIQDTQTKFPGEQESLMSCYNIYSWVGFRLVKGPNGTRIPVVSLKVENYELLRDLENHCIRAKNKALPLGWSSTLKSKYKSRKMSPSELSENLKNLVSSFNMHCLVHKDGEEREILPEIVLDNIHDTPANYGMLINAKEYAQLFQEQQETVKQQGF